jgi:hypothetical protein
MASLPTHRSLYRDCKESYELFRRPLSLWRTFEPPKNKLSRSCLRLPAAGGAALDSISQLQEIGVRPMIPLPSLCNDKSAYADGMCRGPCGIGRCRAMHRIGNANT